MRLRAADCGGKSGLAALGRRSPGRRGDAPPERRWPRRVGEARSQRAHPTTAWVNPGRRHLPLLEKLCRDGDARGDLVSDAVIAALAVEAGATVVTYDRDFARFSEVRWTTPG